MLRIETEEAKSSSSWIEQTVNNFIQYATLQVTVYEGPFSYKMKWDNYINN